MRPFPALPSCSPRTGRPSGSAPGAVGLWWRAKELFLRGTLLRLCPLENSKFFEAKKKQLTKAVAAALLKDGRAKLTGCWSERIGKTYDATVVLDDDGQRVGFKLVFAKRQ